MRKHFIRKASELQKLLSEVTPNDLIAFDTETTGLKASDRAFGVSMSWRNIDLYVDIREVPEAIELLGKLLANHKRIIMFNAAFDVLMARRAGIACTSNVEDVMVRARLINEHEKSNSLDFLAQKYLGNTKETEIYSELAALFGGAATRNVQMKNIWRAPSHIVAPYAMTDTRLTLNLWHWQEKEIERQELKKVVEFEKSLTPILIEIEAKGIRVDVEKAKKAIDKTTKVLNEKQKELAEKISPDFNVNSAKQVKEIFKFKQDENGEWWVFDVNEWKKTETTNSGNPSLPSPILAEMADPRAGLIMEVRSLLKTRDVFLQKYILDNEYNGRIYPHWNQILDTGRISIKDPALQNIPSKNEEVARTIRECFLPEEGQLWLDSDLSSNEVRVFAHLVSKFDDKLAKEYKKNPALDLHQYVADLTGLPRSPKRAGQPNAKQLNLSAIFNQGDGQTAMQMGLPWTWETFTASNGEIIRYRKAGQEANELIAQYHETLSGVKVLQRLTSEAAIKFGYIRTFTGRKLRIPKEKAYKASAMLIQSTAADINKYILKYIHTVIAKKYDARLLINTHDSYSLSVPKESIDEVFNDLADEISNPTTWKKTRVPLVLELSGKGRNWKEAYYGE